MSAVATHVHRVTAPDVDLVTDVVARQAEGTAWLVVHDAAGRRDYVAAEDVVAGDDR